MNHPTNHFFHHTPDTLAAWCDQHAMPAFRAKQILEWVYVKGVADPDEMTNLSAFDRQTLATEMTFVSGETIAHQLASDGTQKLLVQWDDAPATPSSTSLPILNESDACANDQDPSRQTECVMIPSRDDNERGDPKRRTACLSSQVGCPVGCRFCASGLGGLDGNLSAGRIVEQAWRLAQLEGVGRISHIVFMGMGEPLANFSQVVHAVRTLTAPWGMGISARRVTISTVGLPKAIERLAEELDLPITLALSLHAPNDELRRRLIPWAEYTTIDELLDACDRWYRKTGREITLEYTLIGDTNDRPEHARDLAKVAKTLRANVNLIRFNEVKGVPFHRPDDHDVRTFQGILRDRGINAHIRASRGRDIAAACGQLRHERTHA